MIYISSNNQFFDNPFTYKVFDDRLEFTSRSQLFNGKTRIMTKKKSDKFPARYFNQFNIDFPLGVYESEIVDDKLIIYKDENGKQ